MTGRTRNGTTLLITNGKERKLLDHAEPLSHPCGPGLPARRRQRSRSSFRAGLRHRARRPEPQPDGGRGGQRGVRPSRRNPYRALRELGRVLELQSSSRGRESVSRLEARGRSIDEAALEFLHHSGRGISGARLRPLQRPRSRRELPYAIVPLRRHARPHVLPHPGPGCRAALPASLPRLRQRTTAAGNKAAR